MKLSKLDNSCTLMYLSHLNSLLESGREGMEKARAVISEAIAGRRSDKPTAAILATANTDEQREALRRLGFKRATTYHSHPHERDVFVYIRRTSEKEFQTKSAIF